MMERSFYEWLVATPELRAQFEAERAARYREERKRQSTAATARILQDQDTEDRARWASQGRSEPGGWVALLFPNDVRKEKR